MPIALPFSKLEDIVWRPVYPPVQECFFHFSAESVRKLKAKVNTEMASTATAIVSLLQFLLAHLWRAACRPGTSRRTWTRRTSSSSDAVQG